MNSAIYNERGLKVAGGEVMPQALPDQVFLQEMPLLCRRSSVF